MHSSRRARAHSRLMRFDGVREVLCERSTLWVVARPRCVLPVKRVRASTPLRVSIYKRFVVTPFGSRTVRFAHVCAQSF